MELSGFTLKIFCCAFPLIELMFQCAVESVSGFSDLQHRPKFGFYRNQGHGKNSKLYKFNRRSRSDGSQNIVLSNDNEDISKKASEILEFIETIHSNRNIRIKNCNESKEFVIKLSKFNYKISNKTLFHAYRNQCSEAVSIANALTTYYRHRQNPESDLEASIVLALLRSKVDSNPLIAGGGIAFMNDFPYVYKNPAGITNVSDLRNAYDYKTAAFFSRYYPPACTAVYNDKYRNGSLRVSDGYWEDPVYDCANLRRWVVSYSIPFYEEKQNKRCLK